MKAQLFAIPKQRVWDAYLAVKRSGGGPGADGQTMEDFERDLKNNLYKIWNRMSSGAYFPPPVLLVEIPKADGGIRKLGIPSISDRIAQAVAKQVLEVKADGQFHPDSFGYRPRRSAHDAVTKARERCWTTDWVLDLDIKGFFDNLDHELMLRAVRRFTEEKWILLYVERWLKAEMQLKDGTRMLRDRGTPQGGVISPLLANIFMHFAFDQWILEKHPDIQFERYADDIVVHCRTHDNAILMKEVIGLRLAQCKLELHPEKTKIVYCKDSNRSICFPVTQFNFLGFTFRPRSSRNRARKLFVSFTPAISEKANVSIRKVVRREWRLSAKAHFSLDDVARWLRPKITGWIMYYGKFCKSALNAIFSNINDALIRWVLRKFKKYRGHKTRAAQWLKGVARRDINLFPHWRFGFVKAK